MTPWQAIDWDVRVRVPTFLRAAGLDDHATTLAGLPEFTSLRGLADVKLTLHAAARAAYGAWQDRKPPTGSHACTAARQSAEEARGITMLPTAGLALPIAAELASLTDAKLQADARYAADEAEVAAGWGAALVAADALRGHEGEDSETWTLARAKLAPVIREVMTSWKG
jgi:hypothetical protein